MRQLSVKAIVLKRIPYQNEKKTLVCVLSDALGKITIGAYKSKTMGSRERLLEPLSVCEILLHKNDHGHYTASEVKVTDACYPNDESDLPIMQLLYSVAGILYKNIEEESIDYDLFKLALETITMLKKTKKTILYDVFRVTLLNHMGLAPVVTHCSRCKKKFSDTHAYFHPDEGTITCDDCTGNDRQNPLSFNTLKLIHFCMHAPMETVLSIKVDDAIRHEFSSFNDGLFATHQIVGSIHTER